MDSKYSKYEIVSPVWMGEEFFEKVLRQHKKDESIKVTSLKITPATLNNNHYASLMYRAKVEYSSKSKPNSISLVIKTVPEYDSIKKDLIGDTFIFRNEIRMYSETIPKMEAVLRKYGDNTVLGAKLIYSALEPIEVIVFEDLVEKGFTTLHNRHPTEEEIKCALLKLAKWHAVSYKLAQEEPDLITNYNDGTFNLDVENIGMFSEGVKNFINVLLSSDDELKKYIPYFKELEKIKTDVCRNLCNAYKRGDKALFVLNHGDFHIRNMMFKRKASGELEDLMLVDFQMSFYGPAVADIIYSIYMLLDSDTRLNKRDEIIYYYFSNFIDSLKRYEFKGELPKMADLRIDLIKYRQYEIVLLSFLFPLTVAFTDDSLKLDEIVESQEYRQKLLLNPALIAEVKKMLPRFLQMGYLDL